MRPGVSRTPFRAVIRGIAPSRRPVPRRNAQDAGSGGAFTPSVEAGLRHDGGDADEGLGVEAGGSLRFTNPASGLTLELKARGLLAHEGEHVSDWGAGGMLTPYAGLSASEDGRRLPTGRTPEHERRGLRARARERRPRPRRGASRFAALVGVVEKNLAGG